MTVAETGQTTSAIGELASGSHTLRSIELHVRNKNGAGALGVEVAVEAAQGLRAVTPRSPLAVGTPELLPDGLTAAIHIPHVLVNDDIVFDVVVLSVGPAPAPTLFADGVHIWANCQNCDGRVELQ